MHRFRDHLIRLPFARVSSPTIFVGFFSHAGVFVWVCLRNAEDVRVRLRGSWLRQESASAVSDTGDPALGFGPLSGLRTHQK
jgi:hypothetical protein